MRCTRLYTLVHGCARMYTVGYGWYTVASCCLTLQGFRSPGLSRGIDYVMVKRFAFAIAEELVKNVVHCVARLRFSVLFPLFLFYQHVYVVLLATVLPCERFITSGAILLHGVFVSAIRVVEIDHMGVVAVPVVFPDECCFIVWHYVCLSPIGGDICPPCWWNEQSSSFNVQRLHTVNSAVPHNHLMGLVEGEIVRERRLFWDTPQGGERAAINSVQRQCEHLR